MIGLRHHWVDPWTIAPVRGAEQKSDGFDRLEMCRSPIPSPLVRRQILVRDPVAVQVHPLAAVPPRLPQHVAQASLTGRDRALLFGHVDPPAVLVDDRAALAARIQNSGLRWPDVCRRAIQIVVHAGLCHFDHFCFIFLHSVQPVFPAQLVNQ